MKESMDLQTQNKTYSEATQLITALFLVPGPQRKNTSFSRADEKLNLIDASKQH